MIARGRQIFLAHAPIASGGGKVAGSWSAMYG